MKCLDLLLLSVEELLKIILLLHEGLNAVERIAKVIVREKVLQ